MSKCIVNVYGDKEWRNSDGLLHRTDGPAIEFVHGDKCWYINGKRHRLDGPAVIDVYGYKEWFIDDEYHRLDGPAMECADGDDRWYINGKWLSEKQFNNHPKVANYLFQLELEKLQPMCHICGETENLHRTPNTISSWECEECPVSLTWDELVSNSLKD